MLFDFTKWFAGGSQKRADVPSDEPAAGVAIGSTRDARRIFWPRPQLDTASHAIVFAASGAGKTMLVAHALVDELLAQTTKGGSRDQESMLIVDPKGDLVRAMISEIALRAPQALERASYLNPFTTGFPFNVNKIPLGKSPIDIRAASLAQLVGTISGSSGTRGDAGIGARQLDVLQHVLLGALDTDDPDASVLWALDALTMPDGLFRLGAATRSPRARAFLLGTTVGEELRVSSAARLRATFAASTVLERIIGASTTVQFSDLLAQGQIAFLDLGEPIGGTAQQAFYANLVVRLALEFLMERPSPWSGHHTRVVVDEAQLVAPVLADVAEHVLTTGRSRGVSLVVLSQGTALLQKASDSLLPVLLTNAPLKIIGRLAPWDAEILARGESPRRGSEAPIAAIRARFAAQVTTSLDREFYVLRPSSRERMTAIDLDVAALSRAHRDEARNIEAMKQRLALPDTGSRAPLPSRPFKESADERAPDAAPLKPRRPRTRSPGSRWG